jgi:hypothetical protein
MLAVTYVVSLVITYLINPHNVSHTNSVEPFPTREAGSGIQGKPALLNWRWVPGQAFGLPETTGSE